MVIRQAEPADAMAVARVHVRSWQAAYRTLLPAEYLNQLRPEDRASLYDFAHNDPQKPHTIVALNGHLIVGFASTSPSRDDDVPEYGELCALYVDPEYWSQGFGAALIKAARDHLTAAGFQKAFLWLLSGNVRADQFYRIDQWAPDRTERRDTVWNVTVDELRYRRTL